MMAHSSALDDAGAPTVVATAATPRRPIRLVLGLCLLLVALVLFCRPLRRRGVGTWHKRNRYGGDASVASERRLDDSGIDYCPKEQCQKQGFSLPLWATWPCIILLVGLSGLFSGLTLGLMGLDIIGLQIVQKGDDERLAECAEKIAPIRASGNQLLCTLLLGNVAVNSALSILSADIFSGTVGFLLSTALIVIFGEIIPQAACSRYALQVGARTVPLVRVLMCLFWIFTKPLALALDQLLGQEIGAVYSSSELLEMLKLQITLGATDEATGAIAQKVAEGALNFRDKEAHEVMTPLEDAYMLSTETTLGYGMIREIFETGFSRIPVYGRDKNDYRGLLYSKDLMLADPEDEMKLGDFIKIFSRKVECINRYTKLVDALNKFKKGGTHMALVREANLEVATDPRFEICGVLTMEDIMEEILQEEIVDETDVYVDVDNHVKVNDGRDKKHLNLGVFNPVWRLRKNDRLSPEEVAAIGAHLERTVFSPGSGLELSAAAIEWLVSSAEVQNRARCTPLGTEVPQEADWLYRRGQQTDTCTLVLQGRIGLRVGQDEHSSEAGAFSVIARDALMPKPYVPDFFAFLGTLKVRILRISKDLYCSAKALQDEPEKLEHELERLKQEIAAPSPATTDHRSAKASPASQSATLSPRSGGSPRNQGGRHRLGRMTGN